MNITIDEIIFVEHLLHEAKRHGKKKLTLSNERLDKSLRELKDYFSKKEYKFKIIFNQKPITGDFSRFYLALYECFLSGVYTVNSNNEITIEKKPDINHLAEIRKKLEISESEIEDIAKIFIKHF